MSKTLGRNEACHCGSGKKYKQCCLTKDEAKQRKAREKAAAKAAKETPAAESSEETDKDLGHAAPRQKKSTQQPWKRRNVETHGFHKVAMPRKIGSG